MVYQFISMFFISQKMFIIYIFNSPRVSDFFFVDLMLLFLDKVIYDIMTILLFYCQLQFSRVHNIFFTPSVVSYMFQLTFSTASPHKIHFYGYSSLHLFPYVCLFYQIIYFFVFVLCVIPYLASFYLILPLIVWG